MKPRKISRWDMGRALGGDYAWRALFVELLMPPPFMYYLRAKHLRDLLYFTDLLHVIVRTNAPLHLGLYVARDEAPSGRLAGAMDALIDDLDQGDTLAAAMEKRWRFFPRFYTDLIRVGDRTGSLEKSLDAIRDMLRGMLEHRNTAVGYALYISALFLAGVAIFLFTHTYVSPVYIEIIQEFELTPTKQSRFVMAVASWSPQFHQVVFAVLAVLSLLAVPRFFRMIVTGQNRFARCCGRLLVRVPIVRRLIIKRTLARLSLTLDKLLDAGLPLDEALASAASLGTSAAYAATLHRVRARVREGATLTAALEPEALFPAAFRGHVSVGEASGRLPELLTRVGKLYQRQVERTDAVIADVVAPLFVIAAGGIVLLTGLVMLLSSVLMVDGILAAL
jgi:type IV pilus assembly protein PilC